MSLYHLQLRKKINIYNESIKQFKIQIQETKIELKNETNIFEMVRLIKRLRVLCETQLVCEEHLKNLLRQIH